MSRVGIELAPTALRVVELDAAMKPGQDTCVRSYVVLPRVGPDADAWLRSLRRRSAAVVVWGVGADHRQVVVSNGSYPRMRAEALKTAASAGVATHGTLADITAAALAVKDAKRQPVVLAMANARAVSEAVQPLVDAGLRIKSVLTPADALLVLARARQAFVPPGSIEAYVALDETATCLALIRNGALVSARELPWGYGGAAPAVAASPPGRRDDLAERLAAALQRFVAELGAAANAIGQVTICGGLPELRTMTMPLMERLDVEVETLDSLFAIDTNQLPQPEDLFREHTAELRIAWAAAADENPPIDLLRSRRQRSVRAIAQRAAIAAALVAAIGLGWGVTRTGWWRTIAPAMRTAVARPTPPKAPPREAARRSSPPPAPPATRGPSASNPVARANPPAPAPTVRVQQPPLVARTRVSPLGALARPLTPPAIVLPAPPPAAPQTAVARPVAPPTPAPRTVPAAPPRTAPPTRPVPQPNPPAVAAARPTPPAAATLPVAPTVRVSPPVTTPPPAQPSRATITPPRTTAPPKSARPAVPEPAPTPFDATLGTILYSTDRKLAVIDGRIVGVGDVVKGARITDISPTVVLLRDANGRPRSLALGNPGR